MEAIIVLLILIIAILSIGAKFTFIAICILIFLFVAFIVIGNMIESNQYKKEEQKEKKRLIYKQRQAYINGEITREEFEYMPLSIMGVKEIEKEKKKRMEANGLLYDEPEY